MTTANNFKSHCPQLLILADDVTGAFDTGVQFAKRGISVKLMEESFSSQKCPAETVCIINTESRHLSPEEAYQKIKKLLLCTKHWQIPFLYIKTDSALRGNISAVFKAVLNQSEEDFIAFAPAYPDAGRTTKKGIQLIDGVPADQSVFGKDSLEPVTTSKIADLIASGHLTAAECASFREDLSRKKGTVIFDAETNGDLDHIAAALKKQNRLNITAGCAGFAAALVPYLELPREKQASCFQPSLQLVVCGSMNPITQKQIEYGLRRGFEKITLTEEQLLNENYFCSCDGKAWLHHVKDKIKAHQKLIFSTGAKLNSCSHENFLEISKKVAGQMGKLSAYLANQEEVQDQNMMLIGGDTLQGFLRQVPGYEIILEGEADTGVVLFTLKTPKKKIQMFSKSGGLGKEELFEKMSRETA